MEAGTWMWREVVWGDFSSGPGKEQRQPAWTAARGRALALSATPTPGLSTSCGWNKSLRTQAITQLTTYFFFFFDTRSRYCGPGFPSNLQYSCLSLWHAKKCMCLPGHRAFTVLLYTFLYSCWYLLSLSHFSPPPTSV
jgi:hypothetical protein